MYIIGIHDGHNSGACLLKDNELISFYSEERITRVKNQIGYPLKSINLILKNNDLNKSDISYFVYSSNFMHSVDHLSNFKIWHKAGKEDQQKEKNKSKKYLKAIFEFRKKERIKNLLQHLKIKKEKISFVDHHKSHAATAYYGGNFSYDEKVLVFTADGAGDGLSATVNICHKNRINRIYKTNRSSSIGKLYSRVTYSLGFSPWEHEYKIMGIAPYANKKNSEELSKFFFNLVNLNLDGSKFYNPNKIESSYVYPYLKNKLELRRFDEISAAIQIFTENILKKWIESMIKKTKIQTIALAGGVFMNVKANMLISDLKNVKKIFVSPSCGDESLPVGAAWIKFNELNKFSKKYRYSFKKLYLGTSYSNQQINKILDKLDKNKFDVKYYKNIEFVLAKLLSKDKIIARFKGRMEWGSRALGNRSILCNPSNVFNIKEINNQIKNRDFWMPFAPTILNEKKDLYIKNPKKINSPYMMLAFRTTERARKEFCASIHQYDSTMRAQILDKNDNLEYWKLINYFYNLTGIGGILNTSFNLHGYPIVHSATDAIRVFKKSDLKFLSLENYLIIKNI